jgi:hypothetical protein
MNRWKRAVIHLECAADGEHLFDRAMRTTRVRQSFERGEIDIKEYAVEIAKPTSHDIRYQGTAVFLRDRNRRYLVTARHVLWDEPASKREYDYDIERFSKLPPEQHSHAFRNADLAALDTIFMNIFRVPSLDEVMQGGSNERKSLWSLGTGWVQSPRYTYSEPARDLAIISLDQRNTDFADELEARGYEPVAAEDLADEPSSEGAEIFTVGYPGATSVLGDVDSTPVEAHWGSTVYSLPAFTFGRVTMLHDRLEFFWADMSIYPGNSGGPVIENDRLVGIVCRQATIPVEGADDVSVRIPFGMIIKAKFVRVLLARQQVKDDEAARTSAG